MPNDEEEAPINYFTDFKVSQVSQKVPTLPAEYGSSAPSPQKIVHHSPETISNTSSYLQVNFDAKTPEKLTDESMKLQNSSLDSAAKISAKEQLSREVVNFPSDVGRESKPEISKENNLEDNIGFLSPSAYLSTCFPVTKQAILYLCEKKYQKASSLNKYKQEDSVEINANQQIDIEFPNLNNPTPFNTQQTGILPRNVVSKNNLFDSNCPPNDKSSDSSWSEIALDIGWKRPSYSTKPNHAVQDNQVTSSQQVLQCIPCNSCPSQQALQCLLDSKHQSRQALQCALECDDQPRQVPQDASSNTAQPRPLLQGCSIPQKSFQSSIKSSQDVNAMHVCPAFDLSNHTTSVSSMSSFTSEELKYLAEDVNKKVENSKLLATALTPANQVVQQSSKC